MSEVRQNYKKQLLIQVGGGASAGFVEASIMHPLDLIKTRMQLQSSKAPVMLTAEGSQLYYHGIYDCFQKMYRNEGILSFWKGIVPPILAETPKRAVKFLTFEQYKQFFTWCSGSPGMSIYFFAGAAAGVTEAIVVNPFEVVKVSLQSDRNKLKVYEIPSLPQIGMGTMPEAAEEGFLIRVIEFSPGTWAVTKQVWRAGGLGLNGLFKGISGTVWRNGVFNMAYFGFYNSVMSVLPKGEDKVLEFFKKLTVGFAAGTTASCLNIPFDVAKSRIQGPQPKPGEIKYKQLFPTMRLIYVEEGWRALYKGLLPKVMRLGPGGAIMMVVYDYASNFLRQKFPD